MAFNPDFDLFQLPEEYRELRSAIRQIAEDIVAHFTTKVEPEGFKAQLVAYDKASCVAYKAALDTMLPPEASTALSSSA